jgi:hypothetical protein
MILIQQKHRITSFLKQILKQLPYLILYVYLVIGSIILPDYGISTDEPIQRKHGIISFDYVNQRFGLFPGIEPTYDEYLPEYEYRGYGVAFQVFNYSVERILKIDDARSVFLLRHFFTFILFWISALYFFKILEISFDNKIIHILGLLFYILSPRIFAEAFYNPKDIVLLSWISIGLYTMIRFLDVKSFKYVVIHALVCSLAINARIVGILLPFVTLLIAILSIYEIKLKDFLRSYGIFLLSWCVLTIILTIILWPFLWEDPIRNLLYSFNEMKRFPWNGQVLYWGKLTWASDLPWHYIPSQLLVTTPVLYTTLFLFGFLNILTTVARRKFWYITIITDKNSLAFLLIFFIPILSVIYFHSILYNGWRQMYFIYPAFLLIGLTGLNNLLNFINTIASSLTKKFLLVFIHMAIITSLLSTTWFLVKMHPSQYIYFNQFAGSKPLNNFDGDYFGLSYKDALIFLTLNYPNDTLKIYSENSSCAINSLNFDKPSFDRMLFVDRIDQADIFLTTYYFPANSGIYEDLQLNRFPFNQELIYQRNFRGSNFIGIYFINQSFKTN